MQDNTRGALLMMGSMAAFTFNDTFVKLTGGAVPLFQLVFLRGMLACLFLFLLARHFGAVRLDMPWRDRALVAARSVAEVGSTVFFLMALFRMPLANVTAILQILPLSVALGAALLFREPVGWRRWIAIAVGFGGMLLIVRPGAEGFGAPTIFALLSVVCSTLRDLVTRKMSAAVPSIMVSLAGAVSVTVFAGVASLPGGWQPVAPLHAGFIVIAACFVFAAYLCSVMVMRVGDVSFTVSFRYTGLLWALLIGWLVWGEFPEALTLLGAAIVVAMGIFTLWREARLTRKKRAYPVR